MREFDNRRLTRFRKLPEHLKILLVEAKRRGSKKYNHKVMNRLFFTLLKGIVGACFVVSLAFLTATLGFLYGYLKGQNDTLLAFYQIDEYTYTRHISSPTPPDYSLLDQDLLRPSNAIRNYHQDQAASSKQH
jgi:hypothetical protein